FVAIGPDSAEPDWPPQPDRVFSALVATWAARGKDPAEEEALRWLEQQNEVPAVIATDAIRRSTPVSVVPPNDPASGRSGDRTVMPAYRRRQPRRFPAARPHDRVVQLHWSGAEPDDRTLE